MSKKDLNNKKNLNKVKVNSASSKEVLELSAKEMSAINGGRCPAFEAFN